MATNDPISRHDRAHATPSGTDTVRVVLNRCGDWEVVFPGESELVTCDTLDEAEQLAYDRAASSRDPCEVVVFDAYHRVLRHESIESDEGARSASLH
jgi:hypothetical protein